jgi:peptidoglycan/LPS O-acetylase OafA/YrhL
MLFFVLSGYLVTASALRSIDNGSWSVESYLTQRITRLMVVLLPALALCWFWDSLGISIVPHGLYDGAISTAALSPNLAGRRDIWTLFQNGLFLQGVTTTTYGSNDPLWSLSYEFWYYMFLIPLISILHGSSFVRRCLCAGVLCAGFWVVGRQITVYFLIWLLGAAVAGLMRSRVLLNYRSGRFGVRASMFILIATLVLIRTKHLPEGFRGHFVLACTCSLFIYCVVTGDDENGSRLLTSFSKNTASWSYSLYLLHMPFLVWAASLVIRERQWYPDVQHLLSAVPVLVGTLLYSYLISLITERHTNVVRRSLFRQNLPSQPSRVVVPARPTLQSAEKWML